MDCLSKVKERLKLTDNENDSLITDCINDVGQKIFDYCGIEVLPLQLYGALISGACELFSAINSGENINSLHANLKSKSVSVGDTSVSESYENGERSASLTDLFVSLKHYKKLFGKSGVFDCDRL